MWFLVLLGAFLLLVFLPWDRIHAVWFSRRAKNAFREGRFEEAARCWQRVSTSRTLSYARAARMGLASSAIAVGDYALAIRVAEKELQAIPTTSEWNVLRSQLFLTIAQAGAWLGEKAKSEKALSLASTLGGEDHAERAATATAAVALRKREPSKALVALSHEVRAPVGFQRQACVAEVLKQYALKATGRPDEDALRGFPEDELRHAAKGWKELERFVSDALTSR